MGGSAEATVGAGLGANVLVGGSNRSVALQPLSVSGQTGLNFALGVGDLELRAGAVIHGYCLQGTAGASPAVFVCDPP